MANNFRVTGNYYVSKAGSDSNSGVTGDLPKLTIAGAAVVGSNGNTVVFGTGYYAENFTMNRYLSGDGNVIIAGTGINAATLYGANNVIFQGHGNITVSGNLGISNCEFRNCTVTIASFFNMNTTKFINCTINLSAGGVNVAYGLIFINCAFGSSSTWNYGSGGFDSSYADSGTIIKGSTVNANFNYNNFEGGVQMSSASVVTSGVIQDINGKYYDLSIAGSGGSGTVGAPYQRGNTANAPFPLAAHKIAYACNANSISSPPLFNDVSKLDFTLQITSPHIGTGKAGANIGFTNPALSATASGDADFTALNGAFVSGLSGTTDLTVTSGSGFIVLPPKQYATSIREIGVVRYIGALTFNKSVAPPSPTNQNVPDAQVYTGGDASGGGNPDRLVFEMRWSSLATITKILRSATTANGSNIVNLSDTTGIAISQEISGQGIPYGSTVTGIIAGVSVTISNNATASATVTAMFVTPADFDNNGFATAGTYTKFLWNFKPVFDVSGKSNADPAHNTASVLGIGATYFQIRVTLTNAYS